MGQPNLLASAKMAADDLSGTQVAQYEVGELVGAGGMGIVYRGRDTRLGRTVALKFLPPHLSSDPTAKERFLVEARVAARLEHPNICAIHEIGETQDGQFFISMPYYTGETLKAKIDRGPLPLEEAEHIARQIIAGLAKAHAEQIIHRDIKPANLIVTTDGKLKILDFGIAKGLADVTLTRTGETLGTAAYMSPEQATGDDIDYRTDLWSLGVVIYEMLAGRRPFRGANNAAVIHSILTAEPQPLAELRPDAPKQLTDLAHKLLSKLPNERDTAGLTVPSGLTEDRAPELFLAARSAAAAGFRSRRLFWMAPAVLIVLGALSWLVAGTGLMGSSGADTQLDTLRYAVFPFRYDVGASIELNEVQRLHDALSRWRGLSIVEASELRDALGRTGDSLTVSSASQLAGDYGAGRFLYGEVSSVGDDIRIRAGLYSVADNGTVLEERAARVSLASDMDSVLTALADYLLFRGSPPERPPSLGDSQSFAAHQAVGRGLTAVEAWDLAAADSAFSEAAGLDGNFARAHLWVALIRSWSDRERPRWSLAAEQAALGRASLSQRDRAMSDAVLAEARGDLNSACETWRGTTVARPKDFAAWYGLAKCLDSDRAVVPEAASPSGWRFRASPYQTLQSYQVAFQLLPAILESSHADAYGSLRKLFRLDGKSRRGGYAISPGSVSDTLRFQAPASWSSDTLALIPYPLGEDSPPGEIGAAERQLRLLFRDVSLSWVSSSPRSARAVEAFAISLGLLADPSALDTLRRARGLADDPAERTRIAGTEVWLELAFALPESPEALERARGLADSLLNRQPGFGALNPQLAAGLAALTGRAALAATHSRAPPVVEVYGVPPPLKATAPALLTFAALGGPADSLARLQTLVSRAIDQGIAPNQRGC